MMDTVYFNIIDENLLIKVGFDVNEHIILNEYIIQCAGLESLTIRNSY